jgi:peptide/nickel transport system substrate-binding protein
VDYENAGGEVIQNVYETLVWYPVGKQSLEIVPWLAESYTISSDAMSFTFKLRQGIKFQDGTPFNAQAVNYSLTRVFVIADPNGAGWMLDKVRGAATLMYDTIGGGDATWDDVRAWQAGKPIEVLDEYTVRINLDSPYSPFVAALAYTVAAIMSPTYVEAHGGIQIGTQNEWMNRHAEAGTGPYTVKSWEPNVVTLTRNDNWWGGPYNLKSQFKTVIIRGVDDPNTRLLDFFKGDADYCYVPAAIVDQVIDINTWLSQKKIVVKPELASAVQVVGPAATIDLTCISLNQKIKDEITGEPLDWQPFADLRIRQAFAYAFDHATYIKEVAKNFAVTPTGCIPNGLPGYNPSLKSIGTNLTKAKELLLAAASDNGYSVDNPKTIDVYYNSGNLAREKSALLLASAINNMATGLRISVTPLDWPAFLNKRDHGALPIFIIGWGPDYADPDDYLVPFGHGTKGTFCIAIGYNNPIVTKLIDDQASETDPVKRQAMFNQIQQLINDDCIYVWLTQPLNYQPLRTWVHGYYYNPMYGNMYYPVLTKG